MTDDTQPKPKKKRGFATMDPALVRALAKKGGDAVAAAGTGHRFTSETGKAAGHKGGTATAHSNKKSHVNTETTTSTEEPETT